MVTKKFATEALIGFIGCRAEGQDILIAFRRGFSDLQMVKFVGFLSSNALPREMQGKDIWARFNASKTKPLTTVRITVGPKAAQVARIVNKGHSRCIRPKGEGRLRQSFIRRMDHR